MRRVISEIDPIFLAPAQASRSITGHDVVVISHIKHHSQTQLFDIAQAFDPVGFGFRLAKRGQQHRRQDRDDGDDDQQLDQSEAARAS